jgi:PIN domain nuclease of toxin-antitoxin system
MPEAPQAVPLLLDTHAFVWLAIDDSRVPERVRRLVLEPATELRLSAASVWELAIKSSLGRFTMQVPLARFIETQLEALRCSLVDVSAAQALLVERLPFHHRDPFDRLLVAQAMAEGLDILSADEALDAYPPRRLW